ncbi:MAG: GTPase ObgE [Ruminococcaceae bacterium]|nr:GTPase ObgE [Oscillospiraceae bacterium]
MFFDTAKIYVKAGDGGNGAVSFHREKYVAAGGPDGGDGGRGGDIIFEVDESISTLVSFRYKRKYVAENGGNGGSGKCSGKDAESLVIKVPAGTLIRDAKTNRLMADMTPPNNRVVLFKGGNGGWGNTHFATPTRQIPRFAKPGLKGSERELSLELKLIADVGLLGFPNVGKSTLLSVVTSAKPKIANYHFTTLEPNLGVVELGKYGGSGSFVMADIPGLIEGASEGVGLGHEFLRHIERTRLLIHVVDVSGIEGRNPIDDFDKINAELANYNELIATRPQIIAANKTDIIQDEQVYKDFLAEMEKRGYTVFEICAATTKGVNELMAHVSAQLAVLAPIEVFEAEPMLEEIVEEELFTIRNENGVYVVEGSWVENLVGSVNLADDESFNFFQRSLRSKGVIDALEEKGIQEGDSVRLYDIEFDYVK